MVSAAEFKTKINKASTNMDRLDDIVNGDIETTVTTDGGEVPSLAMLAQQFSGWSPVLANVEDGVRRVQQVVDWVTTSILIDPSKKPEVGGYVGSLGLVANIADAQDIRGVTGETFAETARRIGAIGGVPVPADATDAEVLGLVTGSEFEHSDLFASRSTANKADPNVTDPLFATTAAQLHRLWNSGGALSAQLPASLGTFAVSRRYPVTGGEPHVLSLHGAPLGWAIYFNPVRLDFWNSDGTFHSSLTSGWTVNGGATPTPGMTGVRQVEFTAPTGAEGITVNLRNFADFSNSFPATQASLQAAVENVMLNEGTEAANFVPYSTEGNYDPEPDVFGLGKIGSIIVAIQAGYTYVRCQMQQSPDKDVVWRLLHGETPSYVSPGVPAKTGVLDFLGARIIDRSTPASNTIAAFNTSTTTWSNGIDERAPLHINGMFLGAGHGIVGYEATLTGHGLTDANVGAVMTDGAGKAWVLTKVVSTSKVFIIADNTGAADKWVITTNPPTGSTLTWQSGGASFGAKAFTAFVQGMLAPILQGLSVRLWLDDEELTEDGAYSGDRFRIDDLWGVPNAASLLTYLKNNVGSTDYTNSSVSVQVAVSNAYTWNRWGAMTLYRTEQVREAYARSAGAPGDYSGALQVQRLSRTVDSTPGEAVTVHLYIPDMNPVSGVDVKNVADVTANAAFISFPKTSAIDPANPPSHFAMIGKDAGSTVVSGMVVGYSRKFGEGVPLSRSGGVTNTAYLSSSEKLYPIFVDSAAGHAAAGEVLTITAYRAYFANTDPTLTIPAVVYSDAGKDYAIITSHQVQNNRWVQLPKEMVGRPVSLLKADANVTLHSPIVQSRGVMMSFATTYGDVILEIG